MGANAEGPSRQERFEQYNPYADRARHTYAGDDGNADTDILKEALLAVAFEVAQLRAEIRFGRGRQS